MVMALARRKPNFIVDDSKERQLKKRILFCYLYERKVRFEHFERYTICELLIYCLEFVTM